MTTERILLAIIIGLVVFIGLLIIKIKQNSEQISRTKDFFRRHGIKDNS